MTDLHNTEQIKKVLSTQLNGAPERIDEHSFSFSYSATADAPPLYFSAMSHILNVAMDAANASMWHKTKYQGNFELLNFSVDFLEQQKMPAPIQVEVEILRDTGAFLYMSSYIYFAGILTAIANCYFNYVAN